MPSQNINEKRKRKTGIKQGFNYTNCKNFRK